MEAAVVETCGAKAAACGRLERIAAAAAAASSTPAGAAAFRTPAGCVLPFGSMRAVAEAAGRLAQLDELLAAAEGAPVAALEALCGELRALVGGLPVPAPLLAAVGAAFPAGARLVARSSANVEDLEGMSAAGLYDSLPNVPAGEPAALGAALAGVWASLYTRRAVLSRRAAGAGQRGADMAVLLQAMLEPEASFVLHSRSPYEPEAPDIAVAELAPGMGETLAAGVRGAPWRLRMDKSSGAVATLAFANFSQAYVVSRPSPGAPADVRRVTVDYSRQELSCSAEARAALGARLAAVAAHLEADFGSAQDVEGCCVGREVYVVQSRPQPM
jgi:phosphoglucan,water dikinase